MDKTKKKILVAVDGSDNSDRAVQEAKKYAEFFSGEVTVMTVINTISAGHYAYLEPPILQDHEVLEKSGKAVLEETLKAFDDFKGEVHTKLKKGNPADEILHEAEEGGYDLIVLGSRGLGVFSRSFLGSVSNKVLNHTDTNVLIVK